MTGLQRRVRKSLLFGARQEIVLCFQSVHLGNVALSGGVESSDVVQIVLLGLEMG